MKPSSRALFLGIFGFLPAFPVWSQVTIPNWGVETSGFVADRFGTSGSTSPFTFAPDDGGAGAIFASSELTETRGSTTSQASYEFAGTLGSPVLRTTARTFGANASANASAAGMEGYVFIGTSPELVTINASLTGSYSGEANDFAGNFASVNVYADSPDFVYSPFPGDYLEFGITSLAPELNLSRNGIGDPDNPNGSLSFTANPGDKFWVLVNATSRVYGPNSVADAFNTTTISFNNPSNLSSVSPIPEPSAMLLSLLAAPLLMLRKRKK